MLRFVVVKLLQALSVLLGAATVVFVVLRLSGDPAALLLPPQASEAERAALMAQFGLDKPVAEQYAIYMADVVRGDFGFSFRANQPALDLTLDRLPYTLRLALLTLAFIVVVSVPLGVLAATCSGSWVDRAAVALCTTGQAIPVFVTGTLLILVFSVWLRWLPSSGAREWDSAILPILALGWYTMGRTTRLVRSGMVTALRENFVRTARAKGASRAKILFVHALSNALIPVVTMLGLEAGGLFGRAVIVEVVFAWPGLGRLIIDAVLARDYAVAQAGIMMLAFIYTALNMTVDLLYRAIDPRLRVQ